MKVRVRFSLDIFRFVIFLIYNSMIKIKICYRIINIFIYLTIIILARIMIFSDRICIEFDYCFILIWLVNFMYLFENSYFLLNRLLLIISPTSETRSSNIKIKVALIVNSYSYFHFLSFFLFVLFISCVFTDGFTFSIFENPISFSHYIYISFLYL